MHLLINDAKGGAVLPAGFPCCDCGKMVRPDARGKSIVEKPVLHGIQFGTCPGCGAFHMVLTAKTKKDCVTLEPVAAAMAYQLETMPE